MSLIKAIKTQLGLSVTPANNFAMTAEADDGTMKLARESGQDIMTVDAAGRVAFPQNSKVSFMAVASTDPFVTIPANTAVTCKFPTVIQGNSGGWFSTSTGIFTAPVVWTICFTDDEGSNFGVRVFWKIATAGDVAASNFSFSIATTSGDGMVGWIARVTGSSFAGVANFVSTSESHNSAFTTHTFTPGLTPPSNDALYLMGSFVRGLTTQSGYAITNNNPTWTEQVDVNVNTTRDGSLSLATATATSASSTGDYNLTLGSSLEAVGFLIAIEESTSVTVSPSVLTGTFSVQAPTITGGANVSPAVISATFTVQAPTITFPVPDFTNATKHSTTFNNLDKS